MIVISDSLENAIFSALIGLFLSGLTFYLGRNRFKKAVSGFIDDLIVQKIGEMRQNPQVMVELLKPVVVKLIESFKDKNTGGFDPSLIGNVGPEAFIPMLPKKWQGPAAIASFFLNRGKKGQNQTQQSNTWD